jgi:hypothetical protein
VERFELKFKNWKGKITRRRSFIAFSLIILVVAVTLTYYAGNYVSHKANVTEVSDIILDNLPSINLGPIFVYGFILVISLFFLYPLFLNVRKFPLALFYFGILLAMRAFFMIFTHLQTPSDAIAVDFPGFLDGLNFRNDLFFSGHTAIPFMGFLVFRENKIKYFFLASSVVLGIVVLLMHRHYTIDVLAAFFIAYGTYKIGKFMLNKTRWGK